MLCITILIIAIRFFKTHLYIRTTKAFAYHLACTVVPFLEKKPKRRHVLVKCSFPTTGPNKTLCHQVKLRYQKGENSQFVRNVEQKNGNA